MENVEEEEEENAENSENVEKEEENVENVEEEENVENREENVENVENREENVEEEEENVENVEEVENAEHVEEEENVENVENREENVENSENSENVEEEVEHVEEEENAENVEEEEENAENREEENRENREEQNMEIEEVESVENVENRESKGTQEEDESSEEVNKPISTLLKENGLSRALDCNDLSDSSENSDNSSYHLSQADFPAPSSNTDSEESYSSDTYDYSASEYSDSDDTSQQIVDIVGHDLPVTLRLLISYCNQFVNSISETSDSISIPHFDFTKIHESTVLTQTYLSIEDNYISSVACQLRSIQDILLHFNAQFSSLKEMNLKRLQKYLSKRNSSYDMQSLRDLKRKIEMFEWKLNYFTDYLNTYQNRKAEMSVGKMNMYPLDETSKLGEYFLN